MHVNPTGASPLSYDEWRAKLQLLGARYHPDGIDRHAFAGSVCARRICDFEAIEGGCNAPQISRNGGRPSPKPQIVSHHAHEMKFDDGQSRDLNPIKWRRNSQEASVLRSGEKFDKGSR